LRKPSRYNWICIEIGREVPVWEEFMDEEARSFLSKSNTRIRRQKIRYIVLGCLAGIIVLFVLFLRLSTGSGWPLALQASGLASNFLGAGFLVIGAIPRLKTIIELSKTKWDMNSDLMDSLRINRLSAIIGIILVIVGYVFQGVGMLI
jgi:predicted nucleic acid-binding Zn ribbon protein